MRSQDVIVVGGIGWHDDLHVDAFENVLVVIVYAVAWDEFVLVTEEEVSLNSR